MHSRKGFTLIELMIVICVIGIFASVLLSSSVGGVGIYGYLNSKQVSGDIVSVTSALPDSGIVVSPGQDAFSAAVLLRMNNSEIVSFSTDDRQWATLRDKKYVGMCVVATVFPYAPWDFGKAGTFHGGRLLRFSEKPCAQ